MILVSAVAAQIFPDGDFCLWEIPREEGRKGSTQGFVGSIAKTCFDGSVGVWSARMGQKSRFLIAFLAFSEPELSAHNPEVVGSSPASATRKRKDHPNGWSFLFWLAKQALSDLRVMRPTSVVRCGERPDRRLWRMQGGERVAGVGEGRRSTATEDIRRAPQQGILRLPYQQGQTVVLLNRVLPTQP